MSAMGREALDNYVRGTVAGQASRRLAEDLNVKPGNVGIPDYDMNVDPFFIKIFSVRVLPMDKNGNRLDMIVSHGTHGSYKIPSAEPGFKAMRVKGKPRGTYELVPCLKSESYGRPLIIPSTQMFTTFNAHTLEKEVLSKDVIRGSILAESIINGPGIDTDLREWGVFQTFNDEPTADEVAAAVTKLKAKYQILFNEAESLAVQGKVGQITVTQREAAAWLGKATSWNQVVEMYDTCEGCGENVKAQVVIHSCGWVRNWQKAVENGMKRMDEVPVSKRWWMESSNDTDTKLSNETKLSNSK